MKLSSVFTRITVPRQQRKGAAREYNPERAGLGRLLESVCTADTQELGRADETLLFEGAQRFKIWSTGGLRDHGEINCYRPLARAE